ncbi:DUF883 family protein [Pararobbsia alpina]|uniref:DUF883 domain-containing protein n=1 Tax=Pararobbsia alpina TaxID=621374 RepID=A0A6S7D4L1_9BURK|nr:DUF883 family protein [Pararobbsia alpina]CAB3795893.1 hypothetical protein LMG28138_03968 [Pararobbsia alpina]
MTAFFHTRDALDDSLHATRRHAKRIASRGRHAVDDIGDELRTLLDQLQASLADGTQADLGTLRNQLQERIGAVRAKLDSTRGHARERAKAAFDQTDEFVHQKPWQTMAALAGIALIVGAVIGRKSA